MFWCQCAVDRILHFCHYPLCCSDLTTRFVFFDHFQIKTSRILNWHWIVTSKWCETRTRCQAWTSTTDSNRSEEFCVHFARFFTWTNLDKILFINFTLQDKCRRYVGLKGTPAAVVYGKDGLKSVQATTKCFTPTPVYAVSRRHWVWAINLLLAAIRITCVPFVNR